MLGSRAPGGGGSVVQVPLYWGPRRKSERHVHSEHFSVTRLDSHASQTAAFPTRSRRLGSQATLRLRDGDCSLLSAPSLPLVMDTSPRRWTED